MGTKTYHRWQTTIDVISTPIPPPVPPSRVDEVTLHLTLNQALAVCNYLLARKSAEGMDGLIHTDEVALALQAALNDHGVATTA